MPLRVISLAASADRRERMRTLLDPLGLPWSFFDAVDGRAGLDPGLRRYDDAHRRAAFGTPLRPAEVGCFASHHALWTWCASQAQPLVVMEDDVDVDPALPALLTWLEPRMAELGLVRLGWVRARKGWALPLPMPGGYRLVKHWAAPRGTQSYVLSPASAARLLAHAKRWWLPVDTWLDDEAAHGVPVLALEPMPVRFRDDIDSTLGAMPSAAGLPAGAKLRREAVRTAMTVRNGLFELAFWAKVHAAGRLKP